MCNQDTVRVFVLILNTFHVFRTSIANQLDEISMDNRHSPYYPLPNLNELSSETYNSQSLEYPQQFPVGMEQDVSNSKIHFGSEDFSKFNFKDLPFNPFYPSEESTLTKPFLYSDYSFPQSQFPFSYFLPEFTTEVPENNTETDLFSNATSTTTSTELITTEETTTEISEETTEEPTTTLAPFTLADVKVPIPFLRIEYMISFTFFGLMYGLGFFVLFQSLCVPAAKIAVTIVYLILIKLKAIDPVTLEMALEQLPPI